MDERYDTLCAKEKQTLSVIEKSFQKFDERSDSLFDTRIKKVANKFEIVICFIFEKSTNKNLYLIHFLMTT